MGPAAVPAWVIYTGIGISAAGAVYAGYTSMQTANFNAKMANQEATYQLQKGKAEEAKHLENLKRAMAESKVAVAKSGVSLMSGSAQDVFDENLEEGLYDAVMIRYGAQAEARRSQAEAASFRAQGKAAMTSGLIRAGSTILSGAKAGGGAKSSAGGYQFTTGPE